MTIRDQLRRANPRVDGHTVDRMTGRISDADYQRVLREEQSRNERPTERQRDKQAAEGG